MIRIGICIPTTTQYYYYCIQLAILFQYMYRVDCIVHPVDYKRLFIPKIAVVIWISWHLITLNISKVLKFHYWWICKTIRNAWSDLVLSILFPSDTFWISLEILVWSKPCFMFRTLLCTWVTDYADTSHNLCCSGYSKYKRKRRGSLEGEREHTVKAQEIRK